MFSSQLTAASAAFQAMEAENRALRARIAELEETQLAVSPIAEKETLPAPAMPVDGDDAPDAACYRLNPFDIKEDVCVGRKLFGNEDKRWTPAVYSESQCSRKRLDGDDLCKTCRALADKYAGKAGSWCGRVTEEPFDWQHMLGTAWAVKCLASGKLTWNGTTAIGGAGTDSVSKVPALAAAAKAAEKAAAKEANKAAKAAKAAEKAAAKEAKAAAKEAKAAEKAAAKEAKAAAKAAKEAGKAE